MASKQHYDNRAKSRQSASHSAALHIYRQRVPTLALVVRDIDRRAAQPILSDTDWCAFPVTTNAHAPKLTGMAQGVSGEVVYQWKPATDQMKLIQAAQRLAVAA